MEIQGYVSTSKRKQTMRTSRIATFKRAWESWILFKNMWNFKKRFLWLEAHYARPEMAGVPVILWLPEANQLLYLILLYLYAKCSGVTAVQGLSNFSLYSDFISGAAIGITVTI